MTRGFSRAGNLETGDAGQGIGYPIKVSQTSEVFRNLPGLSPPFPLPEVSRPTFNSRRFSHSPLPSKNQQLTTNNSACPTPPKKLPLPAKATPRNRRYRCLGDRLTIRFRLSGKPCLNGRSQWQRCFMWRIW